MALLNRNDEYPDTPEGRTMKAKETKERKSQSYDRGQADMYKNFDAKMTRQRIKANIEPLFRSNPEQFRTELDFLKSQAEKIPDEIAALQRKMSNAARRSLEIRASWFTPKRKRELYNETINTVPDEISELSVIEKQIAKQVIEYETIASSSLATTGSAPPAHPVGGAGGPSHDEDPRPPHSSRRNRKGSRKGSRKQRKSSRTRRA